MFYCSMNYLLYDSPFFHHSIFRPPRSTLVSISDYKVPCNMFGGFRRVFRSALFKPTYNVLYCNVFLDLSYYLIDKIFLGVGSFLSFSLSSISFETPSSIGAFLKSLWGSCVSARSVCAPLFPEFTPVFGVRVTRSIYTVFGMPCSRIFTVYPSLDMTWSGPLVFGNKFDLDKPCSCSVWIFADSGGFSTYTTSPVWNVLVNSTFLSKYRL